MLSIVVLSLLCLAPQEQAKGTFVLPSPNAQLWVQGREMQTQKGLTQRAYVMPAFEGQGSYTVKARWLANDKWVEEVQIVIVQPGRSFIVDFTKRVPDEVFKMPPLPPDDPVKK